MTPNYDRAARMAYSVLTSLKITELPIDPLSILERCNNTKVHTYDEIMSLNGMTDRFLFRIEYMEDRDAYTVRKRFNNGLFRHELFYDNHVYRPRLRFTLAHELGHIILGHCYETSEEEAEADYFASQLLAPHPLFAPLTINGYDMSPDGISKTFRISKSAAAVSLSRPRHRSSMERDYEVERLFIPFIFAHAPSRIFSEVTAHEAS